MTNRRPSPDALLNTAATAERGRLRIFLGAAPGVGKTYEMLMAAQARQREGVDVVIGVVETHNRAETAALLAGLEVVPRRAVPWQGRVLEEMDVDALLARRPDLALVDELAHTNAPGSRHPKRYQDVEEILAAGIDVYTTLNIQHADSLNDVVARITRVRVRETVPDSVIDRADTIELVDLPPEDLIQRLRDGKVYAAGQAGRALDSYFRIGNLTALRELALRRTARRVDDQMVDYMRSHAIDGPWPAGERVLVCVSADRSAAGLVRHAARLAEQLHAPWTALTVEASYVTEPRQAQLADALLLAQRLGGETASLPGADVATTVVDYARAHNFTHIVVGRPRRSLWRSWVRRALVHRLVDRCGTIAVHVIDPGADAGATTDPAAASAGWPAPGPYAASLAMVGLAIPVAMLLRHTLDVNNVTLVVLIAILGSAMRFGLGPSLVASLAGALAYNFFFLPPLYTFTVADPENVVALVFFAVVAVLVSNLAARVRAQAVSAAQRARTNDSLYQFSRKLAGAVTLDDLLWATCHQIAAMLRVRTVILLPAGDVVAVRAGYPPEDTLDPEDLAAARWCWDHHRAAGHGSDTLPGAKWLFLPMQTARGLVGVVGIIRDGPPPLLTPDQQRLLDALVTHGAMAIERANLAQDLGQARVQAETERLRSALLTSISHDLRTPLTSILGSATSLRSAGETLDRPTRESLLATIIEETERLNRFIGNLLDMTRLEAGALRPVLALTDVADVVGAALRRAGGVLEGRQVVLDLPQDLPLLALDGVLFEQVVFNLLDNAAKYSPPGGVIRVQAERDGGLVRMTVSDEGPGIPAEARERVFDKFHRVHGRDRRRPGTGLGLAICRGFVEAMGGTIVAAGRAGADGAAFVITLPLPGAAS